MIEETPPVDLKVAMSKLFIQKKNENMIRKSISKSLLFPKKPAEAKKNADLPIDETVKIEYPIPHVYDDNVDENFIFRQR